MNKVSGIALLIMLVTGLGLNISNIISLIGSYGFLALILFVVGSLLIGMLMGGRDPAVRSVLGLGTAQRNVAAAILVTSLNFPGTMTLPYVLVASIVLPLILIPTAKRLGGRDPAVASDAPASRDQNASENRVRPNVGRVPTRPTKLGRARENTQIRQGIPDALQCNHPVNGAVRIQPEKVNREAAISCSLASQCGSSPGERYAQPGESLCRAGPAGARPADHGTIAGR